MKIIVGSRGSTLALIQTEWVIKSIKEKNPNIDFEIKIIKTKGDIIQNVSLDKIGDKGIFVKEIENELLEGKIDMAIHSMKDMPSEIPQGLKFAPSPVREDYRDVLILRDGLKSLDDVPIGGRIGTGSKRRKFQLLKHRPDLEIVSIRGNVETRIKKIEKEHLDGVILAAAGVIRMGLHHKITEFIDESIVLPAPAQGALGIEIRKNREDLDKIIDVIKDQDTNIQLKAERSFLKGVNGGCHIPVGALCKIKKDRITLEGLLGKADGSNIIRKSISGELGEEELLGKNLANEILEEMKRYEG